MKCPSCKNPMRVETVDGIDVDTCPTCAGLWFDWMEFKKFDEEHETRAEKLLVLNEGPGGKKGGPQLRCPKCPEIIMRRYFSSILRKVEIDECAKCGGIWLDAGELLAIRSEFKTEAERKEAANKNLGDLFDRTMAVKKADAADRRERINDIRATRQQPVALAKAIIFWVREGLKPDDE